MRQMFKLDGTVGQWLQKKLDSAPSVEALASTITGYGERQGVRAQLAAVETLAQICTLRGRSESIPSLGDEIRDGFARRFEQYGEQTHLLSEKQAHAIARDLILWREAR